MSDDAAAPPDPGAPTPATPPRISRPGGPASVRPPTAKKAPPPPRPPSKVKAYLVYGIIISSVVLIGLIGWRVYVKLTTKVVPPVNVKAQWEKAWQEARNAHKDMFGIQAKVWVQGEEIKPEDREKFKAGLVTLQKTSEKYYELIDAMRKQEKLNSQEAQDIGSTQIILKTWIWDANSVLDPASTPPQYGGLYIPMYRAEKQMADSAKKLKVLKETSREIVAKGDIEEIKKAIAEVRKLREAFGACRDEFQRLDEELKKGLTLPDLTPDKLQELADLRDFAATAQQCFKEARELRSEFPSEEDLNAPPKEEAPKPEAPKEEPKKEEPKPEEPPKKEEPPKDEKKDEPK